MPCAYLLLAVHARLQNLAVVLHALGLILFRRCSGLEGHIGVAVAEYVGRHCARRLLFFAVQNVSGLVAGRIRAYYFLVAGGSALRSWW